MNIYASTDRTLMSPTCLTRRAILGLTFGGLAALTGLGPVVAKPKPAKPGRKLTADVRPKPGRKPKRRFKVVTRAFRNPTPIVLNDEGPATPYPSLLTVAGLKHGRLLDLNVTLTGLSHTWPTDVDLLLVAPNGRSAVILSDVGSGDDVTNLTITLDDQASELLSYESPLVSGRFRPTNDAPFDEGPDPFPAPAAFSPHVTLATFKGINPSGTWKLFVVDDASTDTGSILGGWALTIKARVRV